MSTSTLPIFSGAAYEPERDEARLTKQLDQILWLVKDGNWRTVQRLTTELRRQWPDGNFPENSVQAQLRNLRKLGYRVDRRHVKAGLFEYCVLPPVNPGIVAKLRTAVKGALRG